MSKNINLESVKALIEYYMLVGSDVDYLFQALMLKDMCPKGW